MKHSKPNTQSTSSTQTDHLKNEAHRIFHSKIAKQA